MWVEMRLAGTRHPPTPALQEKATRESQPKMALRTVHQLVFPSASSAQMSERQEAVFQPSVLEEH